jgi:hypothetical protein
MAVTKTYLTEAGARAAAYCQMNNIPLVFKYFILSDGLNYDPAQATALIGTLQSKVNITRIKRLSPNSYLLRGEWRNDQIEQMLPYRELGLFCINPENEDEVILYAYGNSTNDGAVENLEPYTTTGHISTRIIDFSFYVKGAEATFYVDDTQKADVVTVQELREDLEHEIEDRQNAIIDIEHGGTGATTPKEAEFNIIGDTEELTTEINDGAKMYFKQGDPSKTKGSFFVRDSLLFWDYIKRKIKKVLGLDETTYNGNAKTATNLKITVIPENADLDTYTKAGHYVAQANVFFQNTPYATLRNFSLEVFQLMNEEYMAQRLTVYTTGKVYMRTQTYNENVRVWGEWSRVAFINDTVAKAESLNKTLPIAEGGTGATTASEAEYKMIIPEEITTDLGDNDLVAGIYATPDKNKGVIYKRKGSSIWNYIQGKISSVLGLTKTAYGGKASTAGTADTAKALTNKGADNKYKRLIVEADGDVGLSEIDGFDTDTVAVYPEVLSDLNLNLDIMTWANGCYRVSHLANLTNLPTEITESTPQFRLEHCNLKKNNHNPNTNTYAARQSILYHNGNIYVRFVTSGSTAGVYATDSGWNKIQTDEDIILYTKLDGDLSGISTVLSLVNALLTKYRNLNYKKVIKFIGNNLSKTNLTDLPTGYGLLEITVGGYDVTSVTFITSSYGYKNEYFGHVNREAGTESLSTLTWDKVISTEDLDTAVTKGSTNPPTSNAVYEAIENMNTGEKSIISDNTHYHVVIEKAAADNQGFFIFEAGCGTSMLEVSVVWNTIGVDYSITKQSNPTNSVKRLKQLSYVTNGTRLELDFHMESVGVTLKRISVPKEVGNIVSFTANNTALANGRTAGYISAGIEDKLPGSASWQYNISNATMYTIQQGEVVLALRLRSQGGSLVVGSVSGSGFHVDGMAKSSNANIGSNSQYIFYNNSNGSVTISNNGECTYLFVKLYG